MKRRAVAILLSTAMAAGLVAGCGAQQAEEPAGQQEDAAEAGEEAAEEAVQEIPDIGLDTESLDRDNGRRMRRPEFPETYASLCK